jgi:hypothetical protein
MVTLWVVFVLAEIQENGKTKMQWYQQPKERKEIKCRQ